MTWLVAKILGGLALAGVGLALLLRKLSPPPSAVTPKVVDLAERRAGAIATEKESEARARESFVTSAGALADAQKKGEASGLGAVLEDLGAKRK